MAYSKGDDSVVSKDEFPTANGSRGVGLEDRLRGYPWYLGKKSRIDAEQALHRMKDGVFLIRESDVRPGEYAIALKLVQDSPLISHLALPSLFSLSFSFSLA